MPNAIDRAGIAFKNIELFNKDILMRDLGINRPTFRDSLGEISETCDISTPGDSATMNNISGYVGVSQMSHLKELYSIQRANAKKWEEYFSDIKDITLLNSRKNINPSYWVFTILSNNRDELLQKFRSDGFYASKMHLRNDLYSVFKSTAKEFKGINEFSNKQLNLPCGWWINEMDII